MTLEVTIIDNY